MANCPNIYADISGQFLSGTIEDTPSYRQLIVEEIKKFLQLDNGLNRLLFGTDFPIQSYADTLALVAALKIKATEVDKILWENAAQLLKINV